MMAVTRAAIIPVGAVLVLSACATVPTGPTVMVLPGNGKSFEQFQGDDAVCKQWALQQTGTTTDRASTQSTVSGAAVGTLLGAAAGAALGAAAGSPATGAAVGAGVGVLGGTAVGAGRADAAHSTGQQRYNAAYMQCMYAKGNQIPVARGSQPSSYTSAHPAPPAGMPPPPPPPVAPPVGTPPPPGGTPPPPPPGPAR